MKSFIQYPLIYRIENGLVAYLVYIGKMLWPRSLAIFYPHPGSSLPAWQVAGAALSLGSITALVIWNIGRRPYLAVGWLWYLGTLVPVIGLVQVGSQAFADRYTYLPLVGLFMIIAWGTPNLITRLPYQKVILSLSAVILLTALGITAWFQVGHWRNSITLNTHATQVVRNNSWAHYRLGILLVHQGKFDSAIAHLKETVRISNDYAYAHNNLAWLLATHNEAKFRDPRQAVRHAQRACELANYENPGFLDTLAAAFAAAGRFPQAIEAAEKAIRLAASAGQKDLARKIQNRLQMYKSAQPYREPQPPTQD